MLTNIGTSNDDKTTHIKKDIGKRLYYLRKSRKIPVERITDFLSIARSTYNGYEAGTRAPDELKLVRIADFYNSSVDFILGRTEYEHNPYDIYHSVTEQTISYNGRELSSFEMERLKEYIDEQFDVRWKK